MNESEIRDIENKRVEAILNQDLPAFFNFFASGFVATNPMNKIATKDEVFEIFRKGLAGNVSSFKADIEKITFVNGIAIVMGLETLQPKGASMHAGKTVSRRFTNVWIKNGDAWKITARQATIINIID